MRFVKGGVDTKFEILALMCSDEEGVLQLIEKAGRTCYQSQEKITEESAEKFVCMIMERGEVNK